MIMRHLFYYWSTTTALKQREVKLMDSGTSSVSPIGSSSPQESLNCDGRQHSTEVALALLTHLTRVCYLRQLVIKYHPPQKILWEPGLLESVWCQCTQEKLGLSSNPKRWNQKASQGCLKKSLIQEIVFLLTGDTLSPPKPSKILLWFSSPEKNVEKSRTDWNSEVCFENVLNSTQ